jgi:hypothetical protein
MAFEAVGSKWDQVSVLAYKNYSSKISGVCSCGGGFSKRAGDILSGNSKPRCFSCSSKDKAASHAARRDLSKLKEKALESGALLLEAECKTENGRLLAVFQCSCGVKVTTHATNLLKEGRWARCGTCSVANRAYRTGPEHPNWNPTTSDEERQRRKDIWRENKEEREWSLAVKAAWSFTCVISGRPSNDLVSHHLYSYARHPEFRGLVGNGVSISRDLHDEFHDLYGRRATTYQQFKEFYELKTGRACPIKDPKESLQ